LIIRARPFLDALSRGDFEAAAGDFDATMLKVSGPDKLAEFWKQVPSLMGAFKRQTAARCLFFHRESRYDGPIHDGR
jgi:hypothetical protein